MSLSQTTYARPRFLRPCQAIAKVTFLEIVRDKILYNILVCSILLFSVGFLVSRLTFLRPERVVLDFGMSAVNLSCSMIAIMVGAGLLGREFERRTVYVALSHPISRPQFVLGKFAGMAGVLTVNWLLLSIAYVLLLWASGGDLPALLSPAFFCGTCLLLLQSFVLASLVILFSTFSTTSLSAILTIGLYLVGNNVSTIRVVAEKTASPLGTAALKALCWTLPDLERFNLASKVTYALPVSWELMALSLLYGCALIAFFMVLAGVLIRSREV